jgi:hypothetical protein
MNRRTWILGLVAPVLLAAQGRGKGKGKGKPDQDEGGAPGHFRAEEVRAINEFYHPASGLPPGLAKRGDLPPGLEKQLRRNGTLPPGLQKKLTPFPADLERRLPPPPPACRRVVLGGWALLIADATNTILDIVDLTKR